MRSLFYDRDGFKLNVQQQFDRRGPTYDDNNTFHPEIADRLIALTVPLPGDGVLDLGSGTGNASLRAADRVKPEGWVVALDISEQMLAKVNVVLYLPYP